MKKQPPTEPAQIIEEEIKAFTHTSPLNRMPLSPTDIIFDEPLVHFADGDDPIFDEYKTLIDPTHLTPREALAKTFNKSPLELPAQISVISWILPVSDKPRKSNREETLIPNRLWSEARNFGEKFNEALRGHMAEFITGMGYLAVAPLLEPYYKYLECSEEKGYFSNWSERHIAYAAGLGTFSLSDGFITERGIAHRCGSVVAGLAMPVNPRTADTPYSNCLFYVNRQCEACISRCPVEAISEKGHDKLKCGDYVRNKLKYLQEEYSVEKAGCGLCQVKVPCEFRNPTRKSGRKTKKEKPWWTWLY